MIKEYIDFASEQGWPYMLIDWQWYGPYNKVEADITKPAPQLNMPEILDYARSKNVRCWLWLYCTDVNKKRAEKVRQLCEKLGCSPAALCVAYITCNPVDGYAVVSNSTMKQMEDTLTGVDLKITQDMIDWILD